MLEYMATECRRERSSSGGSGGGDRLKKKRNTTDEQVTITVKQASAVRLTMLGITAEWRAQYTLRGGGETCDARGGGGLVI
jgi:hypothetical protein